MKNVSFAKGEVIFRQGDEAKVMYDILSGRVGVYTDYQTADEREIAVLNNEEPLGEMGMIEIWPRSATAVALEDGTELAEISESDLNSYFKDKPGKLLKIMKQLSHRLRETNGKYMDVCRVVSEREQAERAADLKKRLELQPQMDTYSAYYFSTWMH